MIRPLTRLALGLVLCFLALVTASCGKDATPPASADTKSGSAQNAVKVLRFGHFPNVTHAHGLIAHGLTRAQRGWFEERIGPGVKIDWYTYNAGPSAMEAILSGDLDVTYVGPSPALNAHVKSKGADVRVLSAATIGGAALVVHADGKLAKPEDFRGKKIATPQLGNTQDVACRAWLTTQGFKVTQTGGDVSVIPTQNPDQLDLFQRGDVDAVWTVEPWVSRLETEAQGKVFLEEKDALTTVLVASERFLREQPELAAKVVRAHAELTTWIGAHAAEARDAVRAELREETKRDVSPALIEHCWTRMTFADRIQPGVFESFVKAAQQAGFLTDAGDLSKLVVEPAK